MKIKSLTIKNFRGYKELTKIEISDLTAFVGKNDIGKSTVLEALDIFFNEGKGAIKIDKDDVNKQCLEDGDNETVIGISFTRLPNNVIIDDTNITSLSEEYLLNANTEFEVIKKYKNGGAAKVFIKANHPAHIQCSDLLTKKNADLKKIVESLLIECDDKTKNAVLRKSIWSHFSLDLQLQESEIDVTSKDGDIKSIWDKLQSYLPLYSLFQSDRKNSDGDSEIQDPLQEAVKQIIANKDLQTKFQEIADEVKQKLQEVSDRTLEKLREMNPEIANSLNPVIPTSDSLKWSDVFKKVSISGDNDIPINKRGSGVKRLILFNFFRAEAERRKAERNVPTIIYAIEEPETSQHTEHQKKLIDAFISLANSDNTQVLLTTHCANIVKKLKFENLRLITGNNGQKTVQNISAHSLPYPSLNEVNYLAFDECTEEYHNELYGYLEEHTLLGLYKQGKGTIMYQKDSSGKIQSIKVILTDYIRHQIHHPENMNNKRYTYAELKSSIELMRDYIILNPIR